ncbi:hypothetical protein INS49_014879 [Diaporthe citri]|uniref:uncharacterized protein n=1 Tax=Diaporthe citri TaxID=83186 RepID=UPI001C7E7E33|nr:uncharacterized protein INS49_014879 [Diaporthe citri]KAG6357003.1 hypothetical protein INS49_014879 [Diaporthe citri]
MVQFLLDHGANPEPTSRYMTPLMAAVHGGNRDVVKLLLEKGADIEATDNHSWMAVTHASCWGCYAVLETLVQHAPLVEYTATETPPLLPQAARRGRYNTMKILLENGVGANSAEEGQSALALAIRRRRYDICELLLNGGEGWTAADPNYTPEDSTPPLALAVEMCNLDIVKLLLEKGADIQKADQTDGWYRAPLSTAILYIGTYSKTDIIRHLLENKADPLVSDEDGWTPLWTAANEGYSEVVRLLLTSGAAPSLETPCGKNGWTPLCTAVVQEHTDVIQVLVEFGADFNKEVESGATSIALAVENSDAESLRHLLSSPKQKPDIKHPSVKSALLDKVRWSDNCQEVLGMVLAAGADVDMVEQTGAKAPLLMAAMANPTPLTNKLAQTILMYGPSVDFKDEFGNNVLTSISPYTSVNTIRILLRRGAILDVNSSGQGPLIAAIEAGNMDVFKFWLTQDVVKSSVNTPSTYGTSLHHAVRVDNIEMVKTLIQHHGANIDFSEDLNRGTPIMTAISLSRDSIVKMLLDAGAQLTRPAGLLSFPINIASAMAPPSVIRLLLDKADSGVSIDVRDQFERKPAHLACYNSLEAFNELCIPDGDFAAKDRVGRVPLHYAALSGNVKLMEVVIERSQRVGVDINVEDDDGWTPLLWAARFSKPTWISSSSYKPQEMIEYLLNNAAVDASVCVGGIGADEGDKSWSAADIAEYSDHQADPAIISLLRERVTERGMSSTGRGKRGADTSRYCDSVNDGLDSPVLEGGSPVPQDLILDQPVYEGEDDAADATETDMFDDVPEYESGDGGDDL